MTRLRISTRITAPIEDVYQHVTGFGANGLLSKKQTDLLYSENIRQEGHEYVFSEDVRRYPDDPAEINTWRCTFEFPHQRTMRAVDSNWSHRTDILRPDRTFTHWLIEWQTQDNFIRGLVKYIAFKIATNRVLKRQILDPVKEHFAKDPQ